MKKIIENNEEEQKRKNLEPNPESKHLYILWYLQGEKYQKDAADFYNVNLVR